MDFQEIVSLAYVKEQQARAYLSVYRNKVDNEELQQGLDNYCDNMAQSFIQTHAELLTDEKLRVQLRRHIASMGADKKHSGYRFYEALYRNLDSLTSKKEDGGPSLE